MFTMIEKHQRGSTVESQWDSWYCDNRGLLASDGLLQQTMADWMFQASILV